MIVTIIGTGLIGGSLGLSLRVNNFSNKILGVDQNSENLTKAQEIGIIDAKIELETAAKISNLIVLAVPVKAATKILPKLLDIINDGTIVVDMGSTKNDICKAVENHRNRKNFVASHPIAGTENSGPQSSLVNLFNNKVSIICEKEKSSPFALKIVENMYSAMNMKLVYMASDEHDLHLAYISHLSHITSFALGLTVLEIEESEENIFDLAGSGFASTARLAKSSPNMWSSICSENSHNLSKALDIYINNLKKFKENIDNKDSSNLLEMMNEANKIRSVLDGIK